MRKLLGTLVSGLLFAGCAGASGEASVLPAGPGSRIVAEGQAREDAAFVSGSVLNEEQLPLQGADVGLLEIGATALTGEDGSYAFSNLAPGTYTVSAARLGYDSALKRVTLAAHEEALVLFILNPIPIAEVYHDINGPYAGYFTCKLGMPTQSAACGSILLISFRTDDLLWANDKAFQWFNMTSQDYRTFIGELTWQQGTFATSTQLRTSFSHERFGSHWFCSAEGANPLHFRFEKATADDTPTCTGGSQGGQRNPVEPDATKPLVVGFRVPFGSTSTSNPNPVYLAFQQRVTSWISVFYGEPAPERWQARVDGLL